MHRKSCLGLKCSSPWGLSSYNYSFLVSKTHFLILHKKVSETNMRQNWWIACISSRWAIRAGARNLHPFYAVLTFTLLTRWICDVFDLVARSLSNSSCWCFHYLVYLGFSNFSFFKCSLANIWTSETVDTPIESYLGDLSDGTKRVFSTSRIEGANVNPVSAIKDLTSQQCSSFFEFSRSKKISLNCVSCSNLLN